MFLVDYRNINDKKNHHQNNHHRQTLASSVSLLLISFKNKKMKTQYIINMLAAMTLLRIGIIKQSPSQERKEISV